MKYIQLIFVLIIFSFFGTGCSKKDKERNSDKQAEVSAIQNVSEISNVQEREGNAPNFSFTDASGQSTTFDSFKGKVTFVNFWATWCGPCKKELPDLISLSKEYAGKNVKFIGISTDRGGDVVEDVRSFIEKTGIPYQIVISNDDIESAYGNIHAIPTTFIIDENGKIIQSFVGIRSKEVFADAINQALGISG